MDNYSITTITREETDAGAGFQERIGHIADDVWELSKNWHEYEGCCILKRQSSELHNLRRELAELLHGTGSCDGLLGFSRKLDSAWKNLESMAGNWGGMTGVALHKAAADLSIVKGDLAAWVIKRTASK